MSRHPESCTLKRFYVSSLLVFFLSAVAAPILNEFKPEIVVTQYARKRKIRLPQAMRQVLVTIMRKEVQAGYKPRLYSAE